MAASVIAATSSFMPTTSAISSTHSMLISVESMSNAISLNCAIGSGGAKPRTTRPGEISCASVIALIFSRGLGHFRLSQRAQHVPHHLRAIAHVHQGFLDAQLLVARELDVLVLLHELDDAHRVERRVRPEGD